MFETRPAWCRFPGEKLWEPQSAKTCTLLQSVNFTLWLGCVPSNRSDSVHPWGNVANASIIPNSSMTREQYPANRGVSQGSVLSPLLFTLSTRSLPTCLAFSTSQLYADDTNVYVADKTADAAIEKLEKDLHSVSEFLHSRELELNPAKTQQRRKPTVQASRQLRFCGTVVEQSSCAKYLGITIDEHLTFCQQVDALRNKVSAKVNAFRRCRTMLTNAARRIFYLSFVQSTLENASNAYVHSLRQHEYDSLTRISRRSLCTVFGYPLTADVQCILSGNNLTPFTIRFSRKLYLLVFRCVHSSASSLPCRLFCLLANSEARSRTCTRSQVSPGLVLPRDSSRFGYSSLSYLAADGWNSVQASVRLAASPSQFRIAILDWLGYPVRRP